MFSPACTVDRRGLFVLIPLSGYQVIDELTGDVKMEPVMQYTGKLIEVHVDMDKIRAQGNGMNFYLNAVHAQMHKEKSEHVENY